MPITMVGSRKTRNFRRKKTIKSSTIHKIFPLNHRHHHPKASQHEDHNVSQISFTKMSFNLPAHVVLPTSTPHHNIAIAELVLCGIIAPIQFTVKLIQLLHRPHKLVLLPILKAHFSWILVFAACTSSTLHHEPLKSLAYYILFKNNSRRMCVEYY
jgi:hypothetical protein